MKNFRFLIFLVASFLLVWAMSCQSPSSVDKSSAVASANNPSITPEGKAGMGTLRLTITDGPVDDVVKIMVTMTEIRVHQASGDENSGFITVWSNPTGEVIDILSLKTKPFIVTTPLGAGNYNQMRISLSTDQCWIYFKDDKTPYRLSVPSNEIKMHFPFDMLSGGLTQILLDFDAAQSLHVVQKGKKSEYILRPVINPVNQVTSTGS